MLRDRFLYHRTSISHSAGCRVCCSQPEFSLRRMILVAHLLLDGENKVRIILCLEVRNDERFVIGRSRAQFIREELLAARKVTCCYFACSDVRYELRKARVQVVRLRKGVTRLVELIKLPIRE